MEIWKEIDGFGGRYKVSSHGRVASNWGGWDMKTPSIQNGYYFVDLYFKPIKKKVSIHRLVAMAFIPNPEGKPQVNHKDSNKLNNNVENLEWVTARENALHATHVIKTNHPPKMMGYKLSEETIAKRREFYKTHPANCAKAVRCVQTGEEFSSLRKATERFNISKRGMYLAMRYNRPIKGLTFEYIGEKNE